MPDDTAIQSAMTVMQAHINALNAQDENAIAATLHFPHYRLSGTALKVWHSPESYFADFRARAGNAWARSNFSDMQVVQASDNKVHIAVEVLRFDRSGTEIARFPSLWVITREGDRWAAKFRSTFAFM